MWLYVPSSHLPPEEGGSNLALATQSPVRRMVDGLAREQLSRADRLQILGNGVVPQQAEAAIRELLVALAADGE